MLLLLGLFYYFLVLPEGYYMATSLLLVSYYSSFSSFTDYIDCLFDYRLNYKVLWGRSPVDFQPKFQMRVVKSSSIDYPVLADIQIYGRHNQVAFAIAYYFDTYLNYLSILLPTRIITPSPPAFSRYILIHMLTSAKLDFRVTSKITRAQRASFRQLGIKERNLSCPAVSQS